MAPPGSIARHEGSFEHRDGLLEGVDGQNVEPRHDGRLEAFAEGSRSCRYPARRAVAAIGSTPRVGCIDPSSDSSPDEEHIGDGAPEERARGRQDAQRDWQIERRTRLPHVGRCEVHRDALLREVEPRVANGARTRSRLSRTAASGRPTITRPGSPKDDVDFHCQGTASMPKSAAVRTQASTPAGRCNKRDGPRNPPKTRKACHSAGVSEMTCQLLLARVMPRLAESADPITSSWCRP